MMKYLILILPFLPLPLAALDVKEEIAVCQKMLASAKSGELYYKLASAYLHDQELDKAFQNFLLALHATPAKSPPQMGQEEEECYSAALTHYLKGGGGEPEKMAGELIEKYEGRANRHPEWIHLNFLIATAYANRGDFTTFFEKFYRTYPFLSDTFLAYKTQGILFMRLAQRTPSMEERGVYQERAWHYLSSALERNPQDGGLYKVLISLAKEGKRGPLVLSYLKKLVEQEVFIARGDICPYVQEAVAQGELELGQQIIDLAQGQYDFSRAVLAAQEYLNQCRG